MCVSSPAAAAAAAAAGEPGAGGAVVVTPGLPNPTVYDEVYFDSDSEGEEMQSKLKCSPNFSFLTACNP